MIYDDKKFIGSVIRNARQKAHLSQAQLSEQIDMSDKNLGNIENGKQFPQVNNFLRLLEVLNLTVEDFGLNKNYQAQATAQSEIIKIALASNDNEAKKYLHVLNAVKDIMSNN